MEHDKNKMALVWNMSRNWEKVNIPGGMYQVIKDLIEKYPELGYHSVAAFVTDAVRRRIEFLKAQQKVEDEKLTK